MGGFAKSTSLQKHCGQADPQRQHFRAAGWSQKIASMIALAMFILMPFCNVTTVPPERLKLSKHWYIAAWKNRRLALKNATARFNFAFLGAIRIGGNAPKEALAADVSRARLLKNAPITKIKIHKLRWFLYRNPLPAHSSKLYNLKCSSFSGRVRSWVFVFGTVKLPFQHRHFYRKTPVENVRLSVAHLSRWKHAAVL